MSGTVDLVAEFLNSRGFAKAREAMLQEASVGPSSQVRRTSLPRSYKLTSRQATTTILMMDPPHQGTTSELERILARGAAAGGDGAALYALSHSGVSGHEWAGMYAKLEDWVASSLDRHKPELRGVLFPLFAHCYLKLVASGCEDSGAFLQRWGNEHALFYGDQVRMLAAVTAAEHLLSDHYASLLLAQNSVRA